MLRLVFAEMLATASKEDTAKIINFLCRRGSELYRLSPFSEAKELVLVEGDFHTGELLMEGKNLFEEGIQIHEPSYSSNFKLEEIK